MKGNGPLSNDPNINPDFYEGHKVFCPYCNGDVWSGQRTEPSTDPNTWGLYFSGHLVFERIMQYLSENTDILNAKYVLLTGGSAGGLGTFANADWLNNEFKQKANNKDLVFKAAPVCGWFFSGNTTDQLNDPMMPPNDYPHWVAHQTGGEGHDNSINVLWDSYLSPSCVNGLGANLSWHCGSVHNLYKYIETPFFVMQNKFDTNQLKAQFHLPSNTVNNETIGYVEYFGVDTDRSIVTQMIDITNDKNGLFYASCFDHGGGLGIGTNAAITKISGYNSSELVGDWFWERNKLPHYVYDTCNNNTYQLPCNPTCHSYPPKKQIINKFDQTFFPDLEMTDFPSLY